MPWQDYVAAIAGSLNALVATDGDGRAMPADVAFVLWHDQAVRVRQADGVVYLAGNGASASMASHFAADLFKNAGIRTQVFTDCACMTAISNDLGYDQVFSVPLARCARDTDMLVAISSSGRSANIRNAVMAARRRHAAVVTLSGFSADNPLRGMGDVNFYVPADTYGIVESCHAAILHYWTEVSPL